MKAWLIPISLCLYADVAHADQCAWIDEAAAHKAQAVLAKAPKFIEYCEPCGDKAPGVPQAVKNITVAAAGGEFKEVSIAGKPIDLAYVFVKTDDLHYRNLAELAGCPATGVSPSLTIEAETRNGVMISSDQDRLPEQMVPVPAVPAYVAPAPPAPLPPAPQIYVYSTTTHEIAWLAVMLAGAAGFVTGSVLTMGLFAIRRRRAMRPRAMDITARVG
jgi:hypothetical protein